jgi:predicted flavoprotein YhiN
LKDVRLSVGDLSLAGEVMITRTGLQGTGIYALAAPLRDTIAAEGEAVLHIDLRPQVAREALERQLSAPRGRQSLSNVLRKATKLPSPAVGLLHEAALAQGTPLGALPPSRLAALIKALPVPFTATAPIERAISTAGGIAFAALDDAFMLREKPGVFACGEMLDWEAPTGGYLLQACFATGVAAAEGAQRWLAQPR